MSQTLSWVGDISVGERDIVYNFKEFIISWEYIYVSNYKQVIVFIKDSFPLSSYVLKILKTTQVHFIKNTLLLNVGTENVSLTAFFILIMKVGLSHKLNNPPLPWRLLWESL